MKALLATWSDDLFLHGHDLSYWVTDYVDLEESLAVGSMAQEDLAHAAHLLRAAGHDAADRDWRIFRRPVEQWAPSMLLVLPVEDWPDVAARGYLFGEAVKVFAQGVANATDEPSTPFDVILAEQALHVDHWRRWLHLMGADPRTRPEILAGLARTAAASADLFGSSPTEAPPADPLPTSLHAAWRTAVHNGLRHAGLEPVDFPAEPRPREAARPNSPLEERLLRIRSVRVTHPNRNYAVYD